MANSRRTFLRHIATAAAAAFASTSVSRPALAFANAISEIAPTSARFFERTYAIPTVDGVSVDESGGVILARWEGRLYAFSLKCPHKGAPLEWRSTERRVFCPKHKARFLADGAHISGRGTRDLDRYGIRRVAGQVVVDTARLLRQDRDAAAWAAATLSL